MDRRLFGVVAVVGGLTALWGFGPPAAAQFGGGVEFLDAQPQSFAGEMLIQGGGFNGAGTESDVPTQFILVSPDRTRIWGLSTAKGEWKQAPVEGKIGGRVQPILGMALAVIVTDGKAFGFSAATGEWSMRELSRDVPAYPIVGQEVAVVADGRKIHAFSGPKGEWDTLELPEGVTVQPAVGSDYVQVRTDRFVAVFSGRTGKWATVTFVEE